MRVYPRPAMNRRRFFLLLLAVANAALALAAWTRQPWANGPAEWRWQYVPAGGPGFSAAAALAMLAPLAALAALAGLGVLWGHGRLAAWRGAPLLAVACGAAFTFALVAVQPGGFARVTAALVSRNSFGYVWDAVLAPPTRALLADYPAASAGLNQHSLTHPPGPLLAVRALGWLDSVLPAPAARRTSRADTRTGPVSEPGAATGAERADGDGGSGGGGLPGLAAAAIDREVARARSHGRPVPRPPPGPWTVTALAVLLPALSALAAWPLYLLARRWGLAPETALLAAVLWLLAPARSLFTPSFDQALPALLIGAAWLAAGGGRARAAAAGALLFAACFTSYGCLPALPLVAACAAVAAPTATTRREASGVLVSASSPLPAPAPAPAAPGWQRWGALALGFGLPWLALAVAAGYDPWHALRAALEIHQRIAVAPRSYATWLLWNPYDFALLLSPGVLGLAAAALFPVWWPGGSPAGPLSQRPAGWRAAWTWWASLALLLLSGGVRGESGRIWLLWMPFGCLFAAAAASVSGPRGAGRPAWATQPETREPMAEAGLWKAGVALLLATEAALALALAASMVFVSAS